jgi:hypothetical protein
MTAKIQSMRIPINEAFKQPVILRLKVVVPTTWKLRWWIALRLIGAAAKLMKVIHIEIVNVVKNNI